MRKLILAMVFALMLTVPAPGLAGTLILDMTMSTTMTSSSGGASIFAVSTLSGTYVTGLAADDTVIPDLTNYDGSYSIQVNDITVQGDAGGDNSGATFEVVAQFTNLNDSDAWAGASEYQVVCGVTLGSGATIYVYDISGPTTAEYMRVALRSSSGITHYSAGTARLIVK